MKFKIILGLITLFFTHVAFAGTDPFAEASKSTFKEFLAYISEFALQLGIGIVAITRFLILINLKGK